MFLQIFFWIFDQNPKPWNQLLLLELVLLGLLVLFSVFSERVEQVVDDFGCEDAYSQAVGHLLALPFHLHVKRQNHGVPTASGETASLPQLLENPLRLPKDCAVKLRVTYCGSCSNMVDAFITSFLWTGPMLIPAYCRNIPVTEQSERQAQTGVGRQTGTHRNFGCP